MPYLSIFTSHLVLINKTYPQVNWKLTSDRNITSVILAGVFTPSLQMQSKQTYKMFFFTHSFLITNNVLRNEKWEKNDDFETFPDITG